MERRLTRDLRRDLRKKKRTPRRQAAWVVLEGGCRIPCVVWDMSDDGARLAAPRANELPDVFALFLTQDGKSRRFCSAVWRKGGQLGVRFVEDSVANIDLEPPPRWMRRKAVASPPATNAAPLRDVEIGQLLLPGYGPHVAFASEGRPWTISSVAAGMLMLLAAATALFVLAGIQDDVPWALTVCTSAENFCRHPEWAGGATAAMFLVYLTVRGMEE
jgi:hypothetical protein